MKGRSFLFTALTLWCSTGWIQAGTWEPTKYPLERYESIWKSSPFVAAAEMAPKGESIAQRYAVTGFAQIGSSEMVFLFDRRGLNRFTVTKSSPGNGVELLEVTEGDDVKQLKAKIRAHGEVAEISYDASLAASDAKSSSGKSNSQTPAISESATQDTQDTEPIAVPRPPHVIRRKSIGK